MDKNYYMDLGNPDILDQFDWDKVAEELETLNGDWDDASPEHTDSSGSTTGKIYYPSGDKWPAVINSTNHTLTVTQVSHTDTSVEWECLVSAGNTVRLERFTISSPLPLPVVRCFSTCVTEWDRLGFIAPPEFEKLGTDGRDREPLHRLDDLATLTDELCFLTIQILEGRYKGAHRWDVTSEGRDGVTST